MDNIDGPWNFHTCDLCNYRTRFLSRILSHVREHRTRAETHRFICNLHSPEEHKCEKCAFHSHLKVLLTKHLNTVHKAREAQHDLNCKLWNCEKCDFQTYSSLVSLGHNCDKTGSYIFQASQTENGQHEYCQSCKCRHPPNKTCAIFSQSSPNDVANNDMIRNNMKHKRNMRISKKPKLSNGQHIQHPSNKKTCTMSSQSSPNDVDNADLTEDNIKQKRSLHSSKKPKHSKNQHIQHPSNKKTCNLSSRSSPNDVDSDDMTPDNMKHKCILRNSKKPKFSSVEQTQLGKLKSLECHPCPYKSAKKETSFRKHILEVDSTSKNISWFICHDCSNKYKNKSCLLRHVRKAHMLTQHPQVEKVKSFKCAHCSYNTTRKSYLIEHICRKHTPSERIDWFICEHCSFKARIQYDLDRHILRKHTQFVKPEKLKLIKYCDCCSYKTIKKGELEKHILREHTPSTCVITKLENVK